VFISNWRSWDRIAQ